MIKHSISSSRNKRRLPFLINPQYAARSLIRVRNPVRLNSSSLSTFSQILAPPVVFSSLLIALWAYKCAIMVIMQNKIIYMPSFPPFSRSELIRDYETRCRSVEWFEHQIQSKDRTRLSLAVGTLSRGASPNSTFRNVVIVYFQG